MPLLDRLGHNEKVVYKFLDDPELAAEVTKTYAILARARARVAHQQHCPIGELLAAGEHAHLEYKSTLRTSTATGEVLKVLGTAALKAVAAFANSRAGGTLLVGVADDASVVGLAGDHASLHKDGKDDRDRFGLHSASSSSPRHSTCGSATPPGRSPTRSNAGATWPAGGAAAGRACWGHDRP